MEDRSSKSRGKISNANVERMMFVFLGFVTVIGFHHFGLLKEHHRTIDAISNRVQDEPVPKVQPRTQNTKTLSTPATEEQLKEREEDGDGDGDGDGDVDMFGFLEKQKDEEKKEKKNTKIREDSCKKKKRLNIALFYADDWTMKVLGKLNKDVKTPNIDAMADNGILFTNNCVTTSVCWSSRATFATGVYSAIHKHNMPFDDAQFETKVWSETLYPLMRSGAKSDGCKEGYYTGLFGKWHKLEIEEELDAAFDESKIYYGMHWEERDGRLRHVTELNRNDSLEFLDNWERRFNDQEGNKPPFFLTTAFFATHAEDGSFPSYKPENSTRLRVYPDSMEIPIPKTATAKHYQELPYFLKEASEGRTRWKFRFEPMYYQKNIKDMFAMATEVDEAVGAIIDKLKSMGVYDDTVLIFTTDNGNLHGEHGLAEKWYPFEESLRVPLVIVDPRMPKERRGTRSEAWTLNIDLAPTILSIANIPQSEFMQGRDIADLYLNDADDKDSMSNEELRKKVGWREDFFYEFNLGNQNDGKDHPWDHYIDASFALVTDEWKYVYWPAFDYEQLFHRSVDPYDEWDLLNKIFRPKDTHVSKESNWDTNLRQKDGDNSNGCCDTVKSTIVKYLEMKARYAVLKEKAQRGDRV
mmetsp:Transcript_15106/g.35027  ORF Transcript_15106/g.35027 Transcript_15106/m.35027 type:complete len:638 (+) Transcript_15106:131-2044(+)